jgi:curved DNA-binding protein
MEYKDYYRILEVSREASPGEIKRAYRQLAMKYHPDRNSADPLAKEKFLEISEAFQVLSDPSRRQHYDAISASFTRWKAEGKSASAFRWEAYQQPPTASPNPAPAAPAEKTPRQPRSRLEFSEFFRRIFATPAPPSTTPTKGKKQSPPASPSLQYPVTLTLQEVLRGASRRLEIDGRQLEVKIPPGAAAGARVRIPQAVASPKGEKHDLVLIISLSEHPFFTRKEQDVYCQVEIDLYTAVLGGETRVRTLEGEVILHIPPGTQPGRSFRLAGLGLPALKNPALRGDQFVRVQVKLPQSLSPQERQLFEQLAQIYTQSKGG